MGPRYRAPRNPTRSQTSSAKTVQTWHYILGTQLTALNDINALRARGSVYCSSRVRMVSNAFTGRFMSAPWRLRGLIGVGGVGEGRCAPRADPAGPGEPSPPGIAAK